MKRILATLLAALMLISMLPTISFAAEGDTYELVTDVSTLAVGDQIIIAATGYNFALSTTQNGNNRGCVAITKTGNQIAYVSDLQVLTLENGTVEGTFAFSTGEGYLYAASSSKNYLRTQTTNDANGSWKITVATDGTAAIVAQGSNTRNIMQYNSSSKLFACYNSGQQDVAIYKLPTATGPSCGEGNHTVETLEAKEATCTATGLTEGSKCSVCGEILTAQETLDKLPHTPGEDGICTVCDYFEAPAADSALTLKQALALGTSIATGASTADKYYVTGEITEVYNTTYGNMYITDGENTLTVFGTYSADGSVRYDAMDVKPIAGDTVTLYGVIANYNGSAQMSNSWLVEHEQTGCPHENTYEADDAKAPTCTETGLSATVMCSDCGEVVKEQETVPANGHDFDEAGYCTVCGHYEEPKAEATLDFSSDAQRVSQDSSAQVWQEATLVFTNAKGASTSNVANYTNPVRLYKSSNITVEFPNMTSVVFNCVSNYVLAAESFSAGTVTTDGTVVTVTFDEPVDSLTITKLANQTRFTSLTAYAKIAVEEPEHVCTPAEAVIENNVAATCTTAGSYDSVIYCSDPECGKEISRETITVDALDHTEETVAGYAATCTTTGLTDGVICSVCGETIKDQETIAALGHDWDDGVYTEPTYEEDGYTTYTCGVCGETEVETDAGSQLIPLAITVQPTAATAAAGTNATFTVAATGKGLTYQWQWAYADRNTWMNTSLGGFDAATLTVPAYQSRDGYRYRCYITDAQGNVVITTPATLEVTAPEGLVQPVDATAAVGATATFNAGAKIEGATYQWQWAYANGTNWMNTGLLGNKTETLTVEALAGRNGYQYRCRVVMADGSAYITDVATLTVG